MDPTSHWVSGKNPGWYPCYPVISYLRVSHLKEREVVCLFLQKKDFFLVAVFLLMMLNFLFVVCHALHISNYNIADL